MSLSSSLNAGVSGLTANSTRLATISDNIANSSTFGYKRAATEFESMVITGGRGASQYSAGGVRSATFRLVEERGALVGTSNPLDLTVTGRGMLPVMPDVALGASGSDIPLTMTTTGAFRADANGVLRTESGLVLLGWPANSDGEIPPFPRDSVSGLQPVVINVNQTAGDPTTRIVLGANLPATETSFDASGESLSRSIEYFGNLGTSETLQVTFTPIIPASGYSNSWSMVIRDSASANAVVGEYALIFDDSRTSGGRIASVSTVSGGAYDPVTGTVDISVAGGPIQIEIGRPGDTSGLTQLSSSFSPTNITRNGSPVGNMTAVEVDRNGYIVATYDTGFVRRIYQIPLVDVPNVNGLTAMDNQTYKVSPESGSFFLWDAGEGPTGGVVGFAREASTTDVAAELTSLIQTQRAYASNAKVIQTVDEMLQETTNIKR